jgi:hypothetical protein
MTCPRIKSLAQQFSHGRVILGKAPSYGFARKAPSARKVPLLARKLDSLPEKASSLYLSHSHKEVLTDGTFTTPATYSFGR